MNTTESEVKISKLEDLKFRQNVDISQRRQVLKILVSMFLIILFSIFFQTNKNIAEYERLSNEYVFRKREFEVISKELLQEKNKLKEKKILYESSLKLLNEAQAIINTDHLPEGAQPVDRIKKRNKLVDKEKIANDELVSQQKQTQIVTNNYNKAETKLFEADRAINRFAETWKNTIESQEEITASDKKKYDRLNTMEMKTSQRFGNISSN